MQHGGRAWWLVLALATSCSVEPAVLRGAQEVALIHAIQQTLLASVEAEKSAVLATTDEESQAMAEESRRETATIAKLREALRPLIHADQRADETAKLAAFDSAWDEFVKVDQRLLALAVANTNLKAARLAAREGSAALDGFTNALTALQKKATDPEVIRTLSGALVAAWRMQALLLVHIPTPGAAEMTGLEQRMDAANAEVEAALAQLRAGDLATATEFTAAGATWSAYAKIRAEVIRLSRQNTNVFSFDVSVHEKRYATKQCLGALAELLALLEAHAKPAR